MKYLSFRIIFLCVFLPPVLYIFSVQGLEVLLEKKWKQGLETHLVFEPGVLLQGSLHIQDEIKRNIDRYLATRYATKWGAIPRVVVKTKTGRLLYPKVNLESESVFDLETFHRERGSSAPQDAFEAARDNLKIMEDGLALYVTVEIPRNTWLANSFLCFYILLFSVLLYGAYSTRARQAEQLSLVSQEALEAAHERLKAGQEQLRHASEKEKNYQKEIEKLQTELTTTTKKVRATEEEALVEMETLEEKLRESFALRESMENEVAQLRQELESLESSRKLSSRKHEKQIRATMKRFRTLYKHLDFHSRAAEGFHNLEDNLQLRVEEVIHNLNQNADLVTVKRKVFSRKGALPVFESEFAYRGRIYWKIGPNGKTEILAIGTKHTQSKDLAYLENLAR